MSGPLAPRTGSCHCGAARFASPLTLLDGRNGDRPGSS
jgi:hypothetical protein